MVCFPGDFTGFSLFSRLLFSLSLPLLSHDMHSLELRTTTLVKKLPSRLDRKKSSSRARPHAHHAPHRTRPSSRLHTSNTSNTSTSLSVLGEEGRQANSSTLQKQCDNGLPPAPALSVSRPPGLSAAHSSHHFIQIGLGHIAPVV